MPSTQVVCDVHGVLARPEQLPPQSLARLKIEPFIDERHSVAFEPHPRDAHELTATERPAPESFAEAHRRTVDPKVRSALHNVRPVAPPMSRRLPTCRLRRQASLWRSASLLRFPR